MGYDTILGVFSSRVLPFSLTFSSGVLVASAQPSGRCGVCMSRFFSVPVQFFDTLQDVPEPVRSLRVSVDVRLRAATVWQFVDAFVRAHGFFPTLEEGRLCFLGRSTVQSTFFLLAAAGVLQRVGGSRGWAIVIPWPGRPPLGHGVPPTSEDLDALMAHGIPQPLAAMRLRPASQLAAARCWAAFHLWYKAFGVSPSYGDLSRLLGRRRQSIEVAVQTLIGLGVLEHWEVKRGFRLLRWFPCRSASKSASSCEPVEVE